MAAGDKPHAVCVPLPAQGHVTPMMKLAKILYCKGFHITFVNTEYNHRRLIRSRGPQAVAGLPGFRFATIPDGLPYSDADATQDPAALCDSTMRTCLPHLKSLLDRLNDGDDDGGEVSPPVTCVVADNVTSFGLDAAKAIGVPCLLFWTASACGYMGYRNFQFLMDEGLAPLKDEAQLTNGHLDTPLGWARGMSKHMRLRDFPDFIYKEQRGDILLEFLIHEVSRTNAADAVILNTFDELEPAALDAMRAILPPVYTIGPLSLLLERLVAADDAAAGALGTVRASLWKEDHTCLRWLDGRAARSVVYVNYGCITTMSNQVLVEFAWGLANSGYDILWIIRPDLVKGETAVLPPEFVESTKGRCLMASWCEQEAVLRHGAVGVFLTHSGWNSMTESLSAGVPMLCWPFFAEQHTNCRYACTDEWGVGMEVSADVRREALEATIREAMAGDKGREMKRRAEEWKEAASRATQPGGRALTNLENLIKNHVLLPK